jgi:transposase
LEQLSQTEGFRLIKINPAYTSQMCSGCGDIDKENRNMETYQCSSCGFLIDADHNAAINILHRGVYNLSNKKSQQNDNYVSAQLAKVNL